MNDKFALPVIALFVVSMVFAGITMPISATGNGAPSGKHYNLNLIGKAKEDILSNDSNGGHRIFVKEFGKSKIYLTKGETFAVLDADATDGNGGLFQLPVPENQYDEEGNYVGEGAYQIWIRPLGKPHTSGTIAACGINDLGEEICSLDKVTLQRDTGKGKQKFTNVSRQLTTVLFDQDGDPTTDDIIRVDIFSDGFEGYLWDYDNEGLKIVQLRFYPIT